MTHPAHAPGPTGLTGTKPFAWLGSILYVLAVGLLVGGSAGTSPTVQGLAAAAAAPLLVGVVRRNPLAALATTLLGASLVVAGAPRPPGAGAVFSYHGEFLSYLPADLVLSLLVATCARRRTAAVAAGSALVAQLLMVGGFAGGAGLVVHAVVVFLVLAACVMAGLLLRERREHAVALRAQEVAEAVTAERLRIARELHDMVAHSIGIIAIQAGAGSQVIRSRPEAAEEALRTIETTSRDTLAGLRRTLVALRRADPAAPSSQQAAPGLADLAQLVAATADAGVRVDLHHTGDPRPLPADLDLCAYRIVQEALTNVVRHAGTGRCRVAVDFGNGELTVEVVDGGRGGTGPGSPHGFGLIGMRERVGMLNGHLETGPRPGGGFRVSAVLPLPVGADRR
ncbi:hypothetical protein GCM10010329_51580 [Streptomyces spiroverticillatus]|uniref:histidine kinase n=1 Tax=Streptomyces finlayi TaxID=67296 RepID=A0A918X2C4_9ACTN|nr:sensor histidine kinase [Streptomyces finlayi]GHA21956.1 hypothetical protein GCM10010329_51580 [Streptomyces spiroverticillatus]GHD04120.1 hypothetical protein GCM10010334_52520 [Streptomyces finlayi]